jgi:hypothetical protein
MLGLTTAAPDGAAATEHAGDIDPWRTDKHLYLICVVNFSRFFPDFRCWFYVMTSSLVL